MPKNKNKPPVNTRRKQWASRATRGRRHILRPPSTRRWRLLQQEVMSIPIYLIVCHSSVCISYTSCGMPEREGIKRFPGVTRASIPSFLLPENTYILNFTSGGEICMFHSKYSFDVQRLESEFRKVLLVDDRDEILRTTENPEPFVSSVMRAANVEYPNFACVLEGLKGGANDSGVFNLSVPHITFTNDESIIKSEEPGPYDNNEWFLDDLIAETYARTGIHKGIFIFAGCSGINENAASRANLEGRIGRSLLEAQRLLYLAETMYRTIKPTLDLEAITAINARAIARNNGLEKPVSKLGQTNIAQGFFMANIPGFHRDPQEAVMNAAEGLVEGYNLPENKINAVLNVLEREM